MSTKFFSSSLESYMDAMFATREVKAESPYPKPLMEVGRLHCFQAMSEMVRPNILVNIFLFKSVNLEIKFLFKDGLVVRRRKVIF